VLIATFGPTTAWEGRTLTYEDGRFVLVGHGPVNAGDVVEYDRQGHLLWAYDGLREWAYASAGQVAPQAPLAAAVAAAVIPEGPAVAPAAETASGVAQPSGPSPVAAPAAPSPVAAPAATPPAEPAPAAAPSATKPRARWRVPGVLVGLAAILAVGWTLVYDGRWRDGIGMAFTVLAVVFLVALVWTALRPQGGFRRWFSGLSGRGALLVLAGLCVVSFALAAGLLWMPHYEIVVPADDRVVLDDAPQMNVSVVNRGWFSGTYSATYAVDGATQAQLNVALSGGESEPVTLHLPSDTARGPVTLSLSGAQFAARAVTPPEYRVTRLKVQPAVVLRGQTVNITTAVRNSGDVAGTYDGVLEVNGRQADAQPTKVGPGATVPLSLKFKSKTPGRFRLGVGTSQATLVVVKPVRLANGDVIKRSLSGGRAEMTIKNPTRSDAMFVLTRTRNLHTPVLALYVRANSRAKTGGIPDGTYVVWDSFGSAWNSYQGDFYASVERKRWDKPLVFGTTTSTSNWSDANYYHTLTTTRWTNWTITLGIGPALNTKTVSAQKFPTP